MNPWPSKLLTEICNPKQWPTISGEELTETGFPVYGANGQIGHYHSYNHEEPTILITCRGATCGTLNISPARTYVTGNAMALDNPDFNIVDFQFLYYALLGRGLKDTITGAAQPQITRANLSRVSIPTPPLSEQKRMVKLLDEADELRKLRAQADQRTAVLIPALFHEMFGDPATNPKGWPVVTLGEIGGNGQYGLNAAAMGEGNGVRFIRITDIDEFGNLGRCKPAFVPANTSDLDHYELAEGDILIARTGATAGKSYIHKSLNERSVFAGYLIRFKINQERALPIFILSFLQSAAYWTQLNSHKHAVAQPNVNAKQLASLYFPLPPLSTQKDFAKRVHEIRAVQAEQVASRQRLDDLFQSLLHRAFNGEL